MLIYRDEKINHRTKRLWFTGKDWVDSEILAKNFNDKEVERLQVVLKYHGIRYGTAKIVCHK